MEQASAQTGIFINGKSQIVEMLQIMTPDEREVLLNNIRYKNPALAMELVEQSITFEHLSKLSDHELLLVVQYTQAPIFGVALKNVDQEFQRRVLSLVPRTYAEEAYKVMVTPLSNEKRDIKRAQDKIISIVVSLSKRKQIEL